MSDVVTEDAPGRVVFRHAREDDLPAVLALIAEGDRPGVSGLTLADAADQFRAMVTAGGSWLYVGEITALVVATYQLALIRGLSGSAPCRAQIEAVRVAADFRGQGIGAQLLADAERRAAMAGAQLVQLTSRNTRSDAHRFYAAQGYAASHTGFKKQLGKP